jgi:hypothetical protein
VQAIPSSHDLGQAPAPVEIAESHVSGGSTTPLPHDATQSESVSELHADGQHPSPPVHEVTLECAHAIEHPDPTKRSVVQAIASSHDVGHIPSQVSGGSTTPLPHDAEQSESLSAEHPGAQQPSPLVHAVMAVLLHELEHPDPTKRSVVHAIASLHDRGHAPAPLVMAVSQSSGGSTTPLPHDAEQSLSLSDVHAEGQHPSPPAQEVIAVLLHDAEHPAPTTRSSVHATPSSHDRGHTPGPLVMAVSQSSSASTIPLPHDAEQSESLNDEQPGAQQPSPLVHALIAV